MKQQEAQEGTISSNQLHCLFDTSDGVIVSDPKEQIVRINAAALKLFEVPCASLCQGTLYQQFLHQYEMDDEQQQAVALEPWLLSLITDAGVASHLQEKIKLLRLPSAQKCYVTLRSSPLHDAQKHVAGTVHVFHDITRKYQRALHLQCVQRAELSLMEAIGHISEQMDLAFLEETFEASFLLLPPALAVGQQLVDVVRQVLDCCHVGLWAIGPPAGQVYFAAGSGFTAEEEQYRREISGRFFPHEVLDERTLDCLQANEVVILPADEKRYPPEFRVDVRVKQWLMVPLLLERQLAGCLLIGKADFASGYMLEEIELVRAAATQALLVLDCFRCLCEQARAGGRALAQQEMHRLTNEFLNLASHELNTPLTVIKGNIQLAQRRVATLKRQLAEQPGRVSEQVEQIQHPLASAAQSARRQERMIQQLINDARLQTNTLELHLQCGDLSMLLKEAVATQQRLAPERTIVLENMAPEHVVLVMADPERITQVITNYLGNALSYSPADQPVTVQLTVEDAVARVSVHDEGPGIPVEEQGHIWGRFYHAKGIAVQHEPDLSLGLGLYLSRAFIERHQGSVGVQSDPGHGATFWFTLPIAASPRA